MEWLAKLVGGKGNVVIMNGNLAQEAAQMRTKGCKEVVAKYPDIKIIKRQAGNWARAEGLALMENWLHPATRSTPSAPTTTKWPSAPSAPSRQP